MSHRGFSYSFGLKPKLCFFTRWCILRAVIHSPRAPRPQGRDAGEQWWYSPKLFPLILARFMKKTSCFSNYSGHNRKKISKETRLLIKSSSSPAAQRCDFCQLAKPFSCRDGIPRDVVSTVLCFCAELWRYKFSVILWTWAFKDLFSCFQYSH